MTFPTNPKPGDVYRDSNVEYLFHEDGIVSALLVAGPQGNYDPPLCFVGAKPINTEGDTKGKWVFQGARKWR